MTCWRCGFSVKTCDLNYHRLCCWRVYWKMDGFAGKRNQAGGQNIFLNKKKQTHFLILHISKEDMIITLLMMNQAAEFICSMWITGQGFSKLLSCPLQLKPPKTHSPTCSCLVAAQTSSKLKKTSNQHSKERHGWGLSSHHLLFFMNIIPMEFCSRHRLKAACSLEPSLRWRSQVTAKISGLEELLGQLWVW